MSDVSITVKSSVSVTSGILTLNSKTWTNVTGLSSVNKVCYGRPVEVKLVGLLKATNVYAFPGVPLDAGFGPNARIRVIMDGNTASPVLDYKLHVYNTAQDIEEISVPTTLAKVFTPTVGSHNFQVQLVAENGATAFFQGDLVIIEH